MGVNCPSVESSDLTTARKIVPHATSSKREKVGIVCDQGETRGKEEKEKELWKNTE
jgi:hypothetical protein